MKFNIKKSLLCIPACAVMLISQFANAGTMSSSPSAPVIENFDIANLGTTISSDKWFPGTDSASSAKGQTFTTGSAAVELKSVTYQIDPATIAPTKKYVVRVGTVAGNNFTEIHSETFTQSSLWDGQFMTWTFDDPPLLLGNTTYALDIGMTNSSSGWPDGIPYIRMSENTYSGGQSYSSGVSGIGNGTMNFNPIKDRSFHLSMGVPTATGFQFVIGNPASNNTNALIPSEIVGTFNKNLVKGTGNIIVKNLTDSLTTSISINDPRISLFENLLLIETANLIEWNKNYAIQIESGSIRGEDGVIFAGVNDDTLWNFTTADGDPLQDALSDLESHINGTALLSGAEIATRKETIDSSKQRFNQSSAIIEAAFDLVTSYDSAVGPLFLQGSPVRNFDRNNSSSISDQNLAWVVYNVMQNIMDGVYNSKTLAKNEDLIDGYKFGSSSDFPGAVDPPINPNSSHTAVISASFPETYGRETQQWSLPARKPTGTYLAPGSIATVTVPSALVGQGYQIRVGAHSWDLSPRIRVERLERATSLYPIVSTTTKIASPYGGGIYIEVPKGSNGGIQNITVTGAVRSPYFSAKTFDSTTAAEWNNTERNHSAPWADFQSDKFMMQVPTNWIYALDGDDAITLMSDWDRSIDVTNDLMGFPRIRGKETMYLQPDVILRASAHAPGYPAVNFIFIPESNFNGYANNHFVRGPGSGPRTGADTEFHEQGHAYFFPHFSGGSEATVNLLYPAVLNRAFGFDFDEAFRNSSYGEYLNNATEDSIDNTAILWMTSFNFSPRNSPMASWEKAYQPQGHARWMDIARLFGWEGIDAYWRSYMEDELQGVLPFQPAATDKLILRLCRESGEDIRPLFHFWGIIPDDPSALSAAIQAEGLNSSQEIKNLLLHYKTIVPKDHDAYQDFCRYWYGRAPSISGLGVEQEHTRQWDTTSYWQDNNWDYSGTDPAQADGEIYTLESGIRISNRVQEIIDLYFGDFDAGPDYDTWASGFPGIDLSDPNADYDRDGMSNNSERIFGLDPSKGNETTPITLHLGGPLGTFSYTRRDATLTSLTFEIWKSPDLLTWNLDTDAVQSAGVPNAANIETVSVSLSPDSLTEGRLFFQVRASN